MRLSGLASGLDVDSMVETLMKAKRVTYNNMIKKRTKIEWQQEDYRSMSAKIVDFRNNKLSSFNMSKAISGKIAEVSGDTNALTVNSTGSTAAGSLSVKVNQVATAANNVYTFAAGNKPLSELGFDMSESGAININGVSIQVAWDATLSDLATAINAKSSTAKATALYNSATGQFSISSTQTGESKLEIVDTNSVLSSTSAQVYTFNNAVGRSLGDLGFSLPIKVNNVEIEYYNSNGKLSDLALAISNSAANVTASYNEGTGKFAITPNDGTAVTLDTAFTSVAGQPGAANAYGVEMVKTEAKNASITINGISYTQASNRFNVNDYDFTVKAPSAASSTTTVTAVKDTKKIIETVKSFVSEYNNLIASINSELSETRNRGFDPLSSDEKKEMTDDEIEQWQAKARNGTLRNDSTLSQLLSELRTATTSLVQGIKLPDGTSISIGITTGSYAEKGKLVLDEDKLLKALESNPDEVSNLFSNSTTGVFNKMTKSTMTALTRLATKAGTSLTNADATASFLESSLLSKEIKGMKTREELMQKRLEVIESMYYKQFSAMESAINKFNSQSSALTSLSSS